jgi:hypothetical protein
MLRRGFAGVVALVALVVPAPASADYVALGDSYAAGPLIPLQIQPFGCLKSNNNYAHIAQRALAFAEFRDPSCSGAETEDMTQTQGVTPGPNPPQFDSLQPDTQLVTITIGGNDIGFSSIAEDCFTFQRRGSPCRDQYVQNGRDEISERIKATAPLVAEVFQGIKERSPQADVYSAGVLLWELLAGHPPFEHDVVQIGGRHLPRERHVVVPRRQQPQLAPVRIEMDREFADDVVRILVESVGIVIQAFVVDVIDLGGHAGRIMLQPDLFDHIMLLGLRITHRRQLRQARTLWYSTRGVLPARRRTK